MTSAVRVSDGLQTYVKTLTTEEELKEKWIRILLSKATRPVSFQTKRAECYQSVGGGRTSHPQESSASRAYCQEKMRCVKALQRANPHPRQTQGGKKGSRWSPGGAPPDVCVPLHFISTLKLKSFSEWLKQAVEADMHKPSRCSTCEDQQAKLTLHTFLRTRKTLLESRQLQNKLDLHLCNYNSICLVGELLRNLPRASDAPDTVLQTGCKGAME
ncbi:hypothetical protein GN956_G6882 [Arapaima gigas]